MNLKFRNVEENGKSTLSPVCTPIGIASPFSFVRPGPVATTVPVGTLLCAFSGKTIPPLVTVCGINRSMSTRSNNGINRRPMLPACLVLGKKFN
ncbi:hypothetical protein DERP_008171 [Dermatophagoides pteronyssinus]|uniref:Uncharacterized protein n=1 Tax=Dermatophagoides pteronyssinus TaxID=6956 RepID=A0ABQ8JKD7_DERPT|nr:hypothetical protein DERP_008171 [Dermatophagoides pteronyssinus]